MNDDFKAAMSNQAVQLEALTDALRRFEQRLEALSNAVGMLDRSVYQTNATCRSVRDRVDEMSRKVDALASHTRGFNGPASDTSLN